MNLVVSSACETQLYSNMLITTSACLELADHDVLSVKQHVQVFACNYLSIKQLNSTSKALSIIPSASSLSINCHIPQPGNNAWSQIPARLCNALGIPMGPSIENSRNISGSRSHFYHRFRSYAASENKTPAETFPKFPSVLCVINRSDRNPPITAR